MSYSTLFAITETNELVEVKTFRNSRLFTPLVFEYLCKKYVHQSWFKGAGAFDKMVQAGTITDMPDLFASGLAGMEIFKIADTPVVIRNLDIFASRYYRTNDKKLTRWAEIRGELLSIYTDPGDKRFFVFKGTSCDDNVISWVEENKEGRCFMKMENLSLQGAVFAEVMTLDENNEIAYFPFKDYMKEQT